ncbi:unnamed protein product [Bursaphelenchus okinawaensis]|uniref:UDP-glucuronosyltransferase n=1 Tax=Bursaphelenchus okinawaensis TaxID=465554 RepID=A0A811K4Z4_9BILA|nr:unnamed protein product [Bursaphelenchus okinawaensis]CAG9091319.1 unnamed protein product [Bursaphelenchus okinawaensis]
MFKLLTLILLSALALQLNGYKILVYTLRFGQSHVLFMGKIADVLAEAGHDVTFYQHEFYDKVKFVNCSKAKVVVRKRDFKVKPFPNFWETDGKSTKEWMMYQDIGEGIATACYHQLIDTNLTTQLRNENFDIAIGEHFDVCTFALFEVLGIKKHISAYATPMFPQAMTLLGHGITTSYLPAFNNYDMTYWDRLMAFLFLPVGFYSYDYIFEKPVRNAAYRAMGRELDVSAAFIRSSYAFVNGDEHLEFQQPTSQKIIYIGGITQHKIGPLSSKFKHIFGNSRRGVVLVSFGTVATAEVMPNRTKEMLAETFRQFPEITFLFKHADANDPIFKDIRNVAIEEWVPQKEVLAHPKTVGFITHGGLNSVSETAYHGVPAVCVPLFGDQERNCKMGEMRNILVTFPRNDLTPPRLIAALSEILNNTVIIESAQNMKHMMQNKPLSARDRVVKFTEHAVRHDIADVHDLRSRHLNTIQYYGIDVYVPILVILYFKLLIFWRCTMFVICKVFKLKRD